MAAGDKYPTTYFEVPHQGRIVGSPVNLHTVQGLPQDVQLIFGPMVESWNTEIIEKRKSEDQKFAELDVQPGDRLRLTEFKGLAGTDGATLEGEVLGVKFKNGRWKVRIKGFETSGNAVWWPIRDYKVEVLHRAYRWTPEDRLVAELSGYSESMWVKATDKTRSALRNQYGKRAERIKRLLAEQ